MGLRMDGDPLRDEPRHRTTEPAFAATARAGKARALYIQLPWQSAPRRASHLWVTCCDQGARLAP